MESVDGRTVAQPSAPTVYVKQDAVGAWIIIDIQLWFPPAGMVNVDVRETSLIGLFVGLSAGGKSLVAWREPHDQP